MSEHQRRRLNCNLLCWKGTSVHEDIFPLEEIPVLFLLQASAAFLVSWSIFFPSKQPNIPSSWMNRGVLNTGVTVMMEIQLNVASDKLWCVFGAV